MAARVSKDGVTITGSDMVYNYQQVLRQIVYTNRKPAYYLNRVFKLTCSELNGRFTSNEYVQTVSANNTNKNEVNRPNNPLLPADGDPSATERTDNCTRHHQQTQRGDASSLDCLQGLFANGSFECDGERRIACRHHYRGGVCGFPDFHGGFGGDKDPGCAPEEQRRGGTRFRDDLG